MSSEFRRTMSSFIDIRMLIFEHQGMQATKVVENINTSQHRDREPGSCLPKNMSTNRDRHKTVAYQVVV
jgi:hypothetical protein